MATLCANLRLIEGNYPRAAQGLQPLGLINERHIFREILRRCTAALAVLVFLFCTASLSAAAEASAISAAMDSITADELQDIVKALADDSFEGRESGSRGGRAAGVYLGEFYQKRELRGGGTNHGYYQPFGANSRNVLGYLEGSDPELKEEFVLVTAHYDHVGYGNARNSNGPTGYIHNGADDNASGVAGVLEAIDAFAHLPQPPRRSVMFALWDGEEAGLLGSLHWLSEPTVPKEKIAATINVDMIGRLRNERASVYGCRTSYGFRQMVARQNEPVGLTLDFNWLMKAESDHHPFFVAGIPVMMLHTGLHDDYHRPSDDPEKINTAGLRQVSQLLFRMAAELAEAEEKPKFRTASRGESPSTRPIRERLLPPLAGRLGMSWDPEKSKEGVLHVASVVPGGAAAKSGLKPGDRIVKYAGMGLENIETFRRLVLATRGEVPMTVERDGSEEPVELKIEPAGQPVRIGISWQVDDAEPGAVMLTRVVPGSTADAAGLRVYDRVYEVNGERFATSDEFLQLISGLASPLDLVVESRGKIRHVELERAEFVTAEPAASGEAS